MALLDVATFVLAAGALACMRVIEPAPAPRTGRALAELAAGARHLWRAVPLRQMTVACAVALLVIGFSETLTFEVAGTGLGRDAAFVGRPDRGPGRRRSSPARRPPPRSCGAPARARSPGSGCSSSRSA